jgi:hypothetical protein
LLADFGEFLGWFADRTILLMKNHPLLSSGSLVSCLLFNFRGQASRCVKQTTPTGRRLGLFATSHCYYVMLVKSEVFQASHIAVDAAFSSSIPSVSLRSAKCLQSSKSRGKKRAPTESKGHGQVSVKDEVSVAKRSVSGAPVVMHRISTSPVYC